jgi:uncharacterized membrane protein YfcA
MVFFHALLLFVSSVVGSTCNSVAGGGTFFTVPALIFTGVAPTIANATSTLALWPGNMASAVAYRRELVRVERKLLVLLTLISLLGSILGAILLLTTPQATFLFLLPFLVFGATCLFAFSDLIARRAQKNSEQVVLTRGKLSWIMSGQFLVSIYCGYFGGGGSIMMLALLVLIGLPGIHVVNALKTFLSAAQSSVAVLIFALAGVILWPQALLMIVGAIIGGYGGAFFARKIAPRWIRLCIILVGLTLTIYFLLYH